MLILLGKYRSINLCAKQSINALQGDVAGKSFEHFIFMELTAYLGLMRKRLEIQYWRTKTGLEMDFYAKRFDDVLALPWQQGLERIFLRYDPDTPHSLGLQPG